MKRLLIAATLCLALFSARADRGSDDYDDDNRGRNSGHVYSSDDDDRYDDSHRGQKYYDNNGYNHQKAKMAKKQHYQHNKKAYQNKHKHKQKQKGKAKGHYIGKGHQQHGKGNGYGHDNHRHGSNSGRH